jgi:SAM-dependent methyltransferase
VFFEQVDAQIHPFDAKSFDVAIGRSSLMFFGDLAAGLTNIQHSLRPSGRIVFTSWQQLAANEWVREITRPLAAGREIPVPPPDARGPFALSDPDRVRGVLTRAGFCDVEFEAMTAGMWFGTDSDDAFRLIVGMMGWMIEGLDAASRARALDELRSTTMAHETPEGVIFGSASWVIRATRR